MEECQYTKEIATLVTKTNNLEGWQKSQNGSIEDIKRHNWRIEEKLDKLSDMCERITRLEVTGEVMSEQDAMQLKKEMNQLNRDSNRTGNIALIVSGIMVILTLLNIYL